MDTWTNGQMGKWTHGHMDNGQMGKGSLPDHRVLLWRWSSSLAAQLKIT